MKKFLCLVINKQTNETLAEYMIEVNIGKRAVDFNYQVHAKFMALHRFIAENRTGLCRELSWKGESWFVDALELDEVL